MPQLNTREVKGCLHIGAFRQVNGRRKRREIAVERKFGFKRFDGTNSIGLAGDAAEAGVECLRRLKRSTHAFFVVIGEHLC